MTFYAKTHKGNVRKHNEDAVYIPEKGDGCFAVLADGMGGHKAGDVASSLVVSAVVSRLNEADAASITENDIRDALIRANTLVWNESCENVNRHGMGSTATVAAFANGCCYIGQVGDSRAYLFRDGKLFQITKDHSYVQVLVDKGLIKKDEAASHPKRNMITRAVGTERSIDVDTFVVELKKDDVIMLCSDGLSSAVSDGEIAAILSEGLSGASEKLIQAAMDNGGTDNISVIIAEMNGGVP